MTEQPNENIWGECGTEIPDETLSQYLKQYDAKLTMDARRYAVLNHPLIEVDDLKQDMILVLIQFAKKQYRAGKELFYPIYDIKHCLIKHYLTSRPVTGMRDPGRMKLFQNYDYKSVSLDMSLQVIEDIFNDGNWDHIDTWIDLKSMMEKMPELHRECVIMALSGFSGREIRRTLHVTRRSYEKIIQRVRDCVKIDTSNHKTDKVAS